MDSVLEGIKDFLSAGDIASVVTTAVLVDAIDDIEVLSADGIVSGKNVSGTGIPSGTTVLSVTGTTVKLSADVTASGPAVQITFTNTPRFKAVEYSEYIEDMIKRNKVPFINVLGLRERKVPLTGFLFEKAYRQEYDVSIVIGQDAKLVKDVIHGTGSIWQLWAYTWGLIEADRTFGGVIKRIAEKQVESKLMLLQREGASVKIGLETELTLVLDVFK